MHATGCECSGSADNPAARSGRAHQGATLAKKDFPFQEIVDIISS